MHEKTKFAGVEIVLGDRTYVIPPLNFRALREFHQLLTKTDVSEQALWDYMVERLPVIHSAFVRNYPEMTLDDVADLVDLSNFNAVFSAVMNVSGMKSKAAPEGEEAPAQVSQ